MAKKLWVEPAWGRKFHLHWDDWQQGDRYKWSKCGHATTDTKHLFEALERRNRGDKIPVEKQCKRCQRPTTVTLVFR